MQDHFRNREHHFWTHQRDLSHDEQRTAAALVEGPVTENVVIELQGPTGLLAQIRDRVAPDLTLSNPDGRHTDSHFLHIPVPMFFTPPSRQGEEA